MIDTATQTFTEKSANSGIRNEGCSFRMPFFLGPAGVNADNVVNLGGGGFGTDSVGLPAEKSIEVNAKADAPTESWQTLSFTLLHRRKHANAVILPDGTVFIVGGTERVYDDQHDWTQGAGGVPPSQFPKPVLEPELLFRDPLTGNWSTSAMASLGTAWLYHSVAILLPSGQVLVAGGQQVDWADLALQDPTLQNVRSHDAAIWNPPYLFKGPRPQIHQAPATPIAYWNGLNPFNVDYRLGSPDDPIAKVVIMRPGSVTHHFDAEHRYVELPILSSTPTSLSIQPPANSNIAPTGYWMLWLVSTKGIPSEAAFVRFQ